MSAYPFDDVPIDEGIKRHREKCPTKHVIRQDGGFLRYTCCGIPEGLARDGASDYSRLAAQQYIDWRKRGSPTGGTLVMSERPTEYKVKFDGCFNSTTRR